MPSKTKTRNAAVAAKSAALPSIPKELLDQFVLEQFDFERLPQLNRTVVHDLATGRYLQERAPVLIVGPCGTGKSHLAQALGHCAVRQGVDVVFTTCAGLTQSLNAARATGARKLPRYWDNPEVETSWLNTLGLKTAGGTSPKDWCGRNSL
jgi:DNA replication protein DnaC